MDLRTILEQKKMSKYALSKVSGIPKTTIMDICAGRSVINRCSAKTVQQLAKALGCSMEDIMNIDSPVVSEQETVDAMKAAWVKVNHLIENKPFVSELQKLFYKTMLAERKTKILDYCLERLSHDTSN